jgi:hypothetical protein
MQGNIYGFFSSNFKVGLRSHLIHSAFTKNPGGSLDLIRRCDSMSCEGHCVCAPQDQKCQFSPSLGACNDLTACKYLLLEISSISSNVCVKVFCI